ncbi:hypothetical protein TNCV_302311 [Trichonephila clavipes]|nr:hypothetical protein TNCV_302311 [Trichonephila clavipes]
MKDTRGRRGKRGKKVASDEKCTREDMKSLGMGLGEVVLIAHRKGEKAKRPTRLSRAEFTGRGCLGNERNRGGSNGAQKTELYPGLQRCDLRKQHGGRRGRRTVNCTVIRRRALRLKNHPSRSPIRKRKTIGKGVRGRKITGIEREEERGCEKKQCRYQQKLSETSLPHQVEVED